MALSRRRLLRAGGVAAAVTGAAVATGAYLKLALTDRHAEWEPLRQAMTGEVVLPGEPRYAQARRIFVARYDLILPQGVAYCETAADVQACLRFARDRDMHVAVRSSGHSYQGWSTTSGLVVDVSRMNRVDVSGPSAVRLGAGAPAVEVVDTLASHGLGVPTGICAGVASGGYLTGGGIGLQTRKYGMGCDRIASAEVVLPDGRITRCSETQEPDLFWAIRGGLAGNFGVVTELEVRPFPVDRLVNYHLEWRWEHAAEVLEAFLRWYAAAPDELSSLFTVVLPDAAPGEVPAVVLDGGWLGPPAELELLLDALVQEVGRAPVQREVVDGGYQESMMSWFECEDLTVDECRVIGYHPEAALPRDNHVTIRSRLLEGPLPPDAVAELTAAFDSMRRAGQFRYLWIVGMGGEAARPARDENAWPHRDTEFFLSYVSAMYTPTPQPEEVAAAAEWADAGFAIADRYGNGGNYINFPDPELADSAAAYYRENYPRLQQIKRRYDPDNFLRFPQSIEL